jgi:hypothetical protein
MPLERRMATLLAFVRTLEATAQDDVLDLFDIVVTTLFTDAAKVGKKARPRTIRDLDAAASDRRRSQADFVLREALDRFAPMRSLHPPRCCPNAAIYPLPVGCWTI